MKRMTYFGEVCISNQKKMEGKIMNFINNNRAKYLTLKILHTSDKLSDIQNFI